MEKEDQTSEETPLKETSEETAETEGRGNRL